ncbi:MAG: hypothetical protein MUC88_00220 [Planctomycetes bacterium]|jgi:hypothetical protein|nr:hypothetical protein [Planctomycetota bacterium]
MDTMIGPFLSALVGLKVLWAVLMVVLFLSPIFIWIHTRRTAKNTAAMLAAFERMVQMREWVSRPAVNPPRAKDCPKCGRTSPASAMICDCGHGWQA